NRQPQHKAFALLDEMPTSLAQAKALQDEDDAIRTGLLNAYLAPQRYLTSHGEVKHISEIYEYTLEIEPESGAEVQQWYEAVAQPILYQPVNPIPANKWRWDNQALRNEPAQAADLYQQYFDAPINEGERDEVVRAARSTWNIEQAVTAWQAVDDREILLTHQELTVNEHEDWAEMELHEVYQNQTIQRQEVVYYFTLPETAVLTGLWLGNSEDRESRFTYQVAPRGAAQATYRNEVQRNIDPALLEQIGPSQYRLRVFPIEPMQLNWDENDRSELEDGLPMHMWLTWQVMSDGTGWPLPYMADKFNVYWTDDTVRLLNGKSMDVDEETWLPESVPFATTTGTAVSHQVTFANGQTVLARPFTTPDTLTPDSNMRLAVVLDRSRSMQKLAEDVESALATIAEWGTAVDVYLTVSPIRGEAPSRTTLDAVDVENILYFGGQNPTELLHQFNTLANGDAYDAIFVLTDGSGYELGAPEHTITVPDAPVWMVHLGGRFPIGYDDETLTAVQASGGGTVGSVTEGMNRLMASRINSGTTLVDGYEWVVMDGETAVADPNAIIHTPDDAFTAFAARQLILAEMAANRGTIDQLDTLDQLHTLAIENSIVTPFSSMIVLVNTRQEQLLQDLSAQDDRFDREFEDIGETMMEPVTVTGVPEPEEWLLIGIIVGFLLWNFYTNRRRQLRQTIA
ncbi:MAG: TIGR02921 family PEP-CTERM protein, partial [Chloroflexi bacterium]|nr:TIGR02921 family PEP-CTERM protein [Chloroflexota bacterium]